MQNKTIRNSLVIASILGAVSFSGQASAADCKGLENTACDGNNACSWVGGYERKDGRQVKSFCRTKAGSNKKVAAQKSTKTAPAKKQLK
jgi:hypothetical protein